MNQTEDRKMGLDQTNSTSQKTRPQNSTSQQLRPQHEVHKSPAGGKPTNRRLNGAGGVCTSWGPEALTLE